MAKQAKMLWLPAKGLTKIWREVYVDNKNATVREWLKKLDDFITKRDKRVAGNHLMIQLTSEEMAKLKNLYELEI